MLASRSLLTIGINALKVLRFVFVYFLMTNVTPALVDHELRSSKAFFKGQFRQSGCTTFAAITAK